VERVFRRYDTNKTNALSRTELKVVMAELGVDLSRAEAAAVLRQFDTDASGTLDKIEFCSLAARYTHIWAYGSRVNPSACLSWRRVSHICVGLTLKHAWRCSNDALVDSYITQTRPGLTLSRTVNE